MIYIQDGELNYKITSSDNMLFLKIEYQKHDRTLKRAEENVIIQYNF